MDVLLKTWGNLSKENQLLLKKTLLGGFILYVILLALHDLMPYVLIGFGTYYLYHLVNKNHSLISLSNKSHNSDSINK